jgi:tripeptidyl-peptidase-1
MNMAPLIVFFALCILGISAKGILVSKSVASIESLNANGWSVEDCDLTKNIKITFGLKHQNFARFTETLNAVSYPSSPRYGQFLTNSEITEMIAAPSASVDAVAAFLREHNINSYTMKSHGGYVVAMVPASVAAVMFETQLHSLRHSNGQTVAFHSLQGLSLPEDLSEVVTYLSGISTQIPHVMKPRVTTRADSGAVTVTDLKNLYSIPQTYNITNGAQASQAVAEFQFQWFDPADTELFFEKYSTNNIGRKVYKINGTNRPQQPAAEASLDVEYIMAMGSNSSTAFYYVNDGAFLTSLIDFFADLNSEANPEKVVSVSFGTNGDESWDTVDQLDIEIQKLGAKGVTVMFASGDNGVGCENGRNEPDFPNSPHILMVGATDSNPAGGEISAKLSSGGFSDDYPIQDWQSAEVAAFFTAANASGSLPPANQYNKSGRGFPDVSAIGVNLPIIVGGKEESGSGTSFSSPIVGGIISLLNDLRVGAGKSTLGWFNPLLYQIYRDHPEAFQDITSGPKNAYQTCQGFAPQAGWDPVTGLGTLNFQVFSKIINNY